jgi:hypothetical protein
MIGVVVFTPFLIIHVMPWVKRFIAGEWGNIKQPKVFRRPSLQSIGQIISLPVKPSRNSSTFEKAMRRA